MEEREKWLLSPPCGWPTILFLVSSPLHSSGHMHYLGIKERMRMFSTILDIQKGKDMALANSPKGENLLVKRPVSRS